MRDYRVPKNIGDLILRSFTQRFLRATRKSVGTCRSIRTRF